MSVDSRPEEDFSALDVRAFDPHIVIDPAKLPVVEVDQDQPHRLLCDGLTFMVKRVDLAERVALRQVAVWHHLARMVEEDRAAEARAEDVRAKRRDELTVMFGGGIGYDDTFSSTKRAIDHILDMEAAK